MSWQNVLRGIGGVARVIGPIIQRVVKIPFLDVILNAIAAAEKLGGTGPQKMEAAIGLLEIGKPFIIDVLEQQFGVDIPEEAADAYIKAQVQANVDLMNAIKLLPKKVV